MKSVGTSVVSQIHNSFLVAKDGKHKFGLVALRWIQINETREYSWSRLVSDEILCETFPSNFISKNVLKDGSILNENYLSQKNVMTY